MSSLIAPNLIGRRVQVRQEPETTWKDGIPTTTQPAQEWRSARIVAVSCGDSYGICFTFAYDDTHEIALAAADRHGCRVRFEEENPTIVERLDEAAEALRFLRHGNVERERMKEIIMDAEDALGRAADFLRAGPRCDEGDDR